MSIKIRNRAIHAARQRQMIENMKNNNDGTLVSNNMLRASNNNLGFQYGGGNDYDYSHLSTIVQQSSTVYDPSMRTQGV
jgi:hypothetical protein